MVNDPQTKKPLPASLSIVDEALPERLTALAHQLIEMASSMQQMRDVSLEIYDPATGRVLLEFRACR